MRRNKGWIVLATGVVFLMMGCTHFRSEAIVQKLNISYNKVLVLPLVNLTSEPHAGVIIADLLAAEIYNHLDVVLVEGKKAADFPPIERDEAQKGLEAAEVLRSGERFKVEAVLYGSVTEYRYKRGLNENPVVGITLRLFDVEKGEVVWAKTEASGACFAFCTNSLNEAAQRACRKLILSLAKADLSGSR